MPNVSQKKFILAIFLASTLFFIYQHANNLSWDFTVYVSNAKYWAGQNSFFETIRPPIMPLMILLMSPAGWKAAEYIFIITASLIFMYSCIALARACKLDENVFYLFSLTSYVLFYGLINGTELLSLAFLNLFVAFSARQSVFSGSFLALSALSRYNYLVFTPLLFLQKNLKSIVQNIIAYFVTFMPWLAYNFWQYGNFFTSIADSYAMNFVYRSYIHQPVNYWHFITAGNWLIPFALLGICTTLATHARVLKTQAFLRFVKQERESLIMLLVILLSIYQYTVTPVKDVRYVFSLSLPVAYFATLALKDMGKRVPGMVRPALAVFIILNLASLNELNSLGAYQTSTEYQKAITTLENEGMAGCRTFSNVWPILNYLGKIAEPTPRKEFLNKTIEEGNLVVLFYSAGEPDWAANRTFLREFPMLAETSHFTILGSRTRCNPERPVDNTYLSLAQEHYYLLHNITLNTNPCFILFKKLQLAERACNLINRHGFIIDENRALP